MKSIDLEQLAAILSKGLTEEVEFSGRVSAFTGKDVHSVILDYEGVASLSPSSNHGFGLTMNDAHFYFRPRTKVTFQPKDSDQDCDGVKEYDSYLSIPIDLSPDARIIIKNVKYVKF